MPKSKRRGPGKRYTAAEKQRILSAAKKDKLTGEQVQKRFGVSTLTFYRWRGPVRRRRRKATAARRGRSTSLNGAVRKEVQARVRKVLPRVIREEVAAAVRKLLE